MLSYQNFRRCLKLYSVIITAFCLFLIFYIRKLKRKIKKNNEYLDDYGVLQVNNINLESSNEVLTDEIREIFLIVSSEGHNLSEIIERMSKNVHSEIRKIFTKEELKEIIEKTKN